MSAEPVEIPLPKAWSPSAAETFENCARKWYAQRVLKLPDPPGPAALRGTMAHQVLEGLSKMPAHLRTEAVAHGMAARLWQGKRQADVDESWGHIQRSLGNLEITTGAVVMVEKRLQTTLGGVKFNGYVDRVVQPDPAKPQLRVVDYKTGDRKTGPHGIFLLPKKRQVTLYAAAIETSLKRPVSEAVLFWTRTGTTDPYTMTEAALREAVGWFAETWQNLEAAIKSNSFPPNPGALCSWCPAVIAHCPEGQIAVYDRADAGKSIGHHGQKLLDARLNRDLRRSLEAVGKTPPED